MPSGTSNDWGPNSNGVISPSATSRMDYNQTTDSYEKTYSLNIGCLLYTSDAADE